jgi:hypothetical protein
MRAGLSSETVPAAGKSTTQIAGRWQSTRQENRLIGKADEMTVVELKFKKISNHYVNASSALAF